MTRLAEFPRPIKRSIRGGGEGDSDFPPVSRLFSRRRVEAVGRVSLVTVLRDVTVSGNVPKIDLKCQHVLCTSHGVARKAVVAAVAGVVTAAIAVTANVERALLLQLVFKNT